MKTIIVTQQGEKMGKSPAIMAIYHELLNRNAVFNKPVISANEINAEGDYNGKRIGIESMGDPDSRLKNSLADFETNNCEVIICASRRIDPTKEDVLKYRAKGYKIIETSHYFYKNSDADTHGTNLIAPNVDLNQLYAKAIVDLVDAVI